MDFILIIAVIVVFGSILFSAFEAVTHGKN